MRTLSLGYVDRILLIGVLGFIVVGFTPIYKVLQPSPRALDPGDGSLLDQVMFGLLYGCVLLAFLLRGTGRIRFAASDIALWTLVALAVISTAWSVDPELSLRRSLALVGTTIVGYFFATSLDLRGQVRVLASIMSVSAFVNFGLGLLLPIVGRDEFGNWTGMLTQKNELGRMMALTAILAIVTTAGSSKATRLYFRFVFAIAVVTLVLTNSATSMVALATLLFLYWLLRSAVLPSSTFVAITSLALCTSVLASTWLLYNFEQATSALGRDTSLTGRTELWQLSLRMVEAQPVLGYGYNGFWLGLSGPSQAIQSRLHFFAVHAHNGFIDLALELGLIGLALYIFVLVVALTRAFWLQIAAPRAENAWPFLLLAFVTLINFTENVIMTRNSILWVAFVAVVATLPRINRGSDGDESALSDVAPTHLPRPAPPSLSHGLKP